MILLDALGLGDLRRLGAPLRRHDHDAKPDANVKAISGIMKSQPERRPEARLQISACFTSVIASENIALSLLRSRSPGAWKELPSPRAQFLVALLQIEPR
jgi:hypothetical protein